jgi:hypothetical protein
MHSATFTDSRKEFLPIGKMIVGGSDHPNSPVPLVMKDFSLRPLRFFFALFAVKDFLDESINGRLNDAISPCSLW